MNQALKCSAPAAVEVLTKATLRAAALLGVNQSELAAILGLSPAAVSRAAKGGLLPATGKTGEIATLFLRLYRSLDAIVGGEDAVAARWLRNPNSALGAVPIEAMRSLAGLNQTLAYLDARRAV